MTKKISTDAELISRLLTTQPTPAECLVAAARIEQLANAARAPLAEALAVPEVAALVDAAEGLSAILDKHETKGPLPDIAMMLCWLAAQNVRAALRAIGERANG